ncbi:scarecrow-like protein 30 [Rosa chinensis]|uniref:scarecrow-like protein 30 n=1 Tax=Rosa chinensis TaxID=74649 RepID=UPI000D08AE52|nr:scarecrow-like protein 30 [Rosa chinensis]
MDEFPSSMNNFMFYQNSMPTSGQNILVTESDQHNHEFSDPSFFPSNPNPPSRDDSSSSLGLSSEGEYYSPSIATLQYISQMLMEEDLQNKPCMLQDCLALQATEKSLHDVLVQQYPSSTNHLLTSTQQNVEISDDFINHSSNSSTAARNWDDGSGWISLQNVLESFPVENTTLSVPNPFSSNGKSEIIDLERDSSFLIQPRELTEDGNDSTNRSRSKKDRQWEDGDYQEQGRSNKQTALYAAESEPPEMLDQVLLYQYQNSGSSLQESDQLKTRSGFRGLKGKRTGKKKMDDNGAVVDFQTLLTQCAKAVASYDTRTANEQLKLIRQHSSPHGDGTQRLAHYFANGLEERLIAAVPLYNPVSLFSYKMSAADILKAYQTYIKACPFKLMSNIYANKTIFKLAEKVTRLHIIDFGILYGYQWPSLIQMLAKRPSGPPMLHITGIEFPQSGFRPSGRLEETGNRLAKYCKRFNVPFEYNFIAQSWDTIQYEDIKLDRDELTVVNCLYRLKNLHDETVINSPRDTVLKLIRRINPDIFIHGVVNGAYNAPFFNIRFREALYYFSSLFDVFEETLPREDQQRLLYEQEIFGRDIINVIACEGSRRLERPETYKQWQIRNTRAGFKQLPLNQEIVKKVKNIVRLDYHEDFVVDKDGKWLLQGWKGRIIHAICCWKSA